MKNLIKSLIISLILTHNSFGQIPVTDAATGAAISANNVLATQNVAKNAGILAKAGATLQTLNNMKKQYDEWEENISEVKIYIEYGKQAVNISDMLDEVSETYSSSITIIKSSNYLSPSAIEKVIYVFGSLLSDCVEITSESVDFITSGTYKMNDAERLAFLKDAEKDLRDKLRLMQYMSKKIQYGEKRARTNEINNSLFTSNTPTFKN